MIKRFLVLFLMAGLAGNLLAASSNSTNREALLELLDGSSLHGSLQGIEKQSGLTWEYPFAKKPLQLFLTNIASIRFEEAQNSSPDFQPNSRFYFKNGDELIGNLLSLSGGEAKLESWFGENLKAPVAALDSVTFSARGYKLIYDGPNGIDGWRIGRNPRSWEYRDGAFIANGADLLGRDFGLTGSSTLEFDLSWTGSFSLSITLYAQVIDRFDYSTSAYLIYLGTGAISVQRVQAGAGAIMLGQTQIPEMLRKNKMHFEIRANKEDATISLYADGHFIQRWKDTAGFVAKGSGIVFFSQVDPRSLRLSNIRVAEWDGKFEPETLTNAPPGLDILFLANRDKVMGKVQSLDSGNVTVESKQGTTLSIPITRVTQIRFAQNDLPAPTVRGTHVRANFPGGETMAFILERWTAHEVQGRSPTFGEVSFPSAAIRQLNFGTTEPSDADHLPEFNFPEFE